MCLSIEPGNEQYQRKGYRKTMRIAFALLECRACFRLRHELHLPDERDGLALKPGPIGKLEVELSSTYFSSLG